MKSSKHPNHSQEHFRQTGTFKPIGIELQFLAKNTGQTKFEIHSHEMSQFYNHIGQESDQQGGWWRIYLNQQLMQLGRKELDIIVLLAFQYMLKHRYIEHYNSLFTNINNLLIEYVGTLANSFCSSHLDANCIIVRQSLGNKRLKTQSYLLDCYQFKQKNQIRILKDFNQQMEIKMTQKFQLCYLVFKNKIFYLTKDLFKQDCYLELSNHDLVQSQVNITQNILIIKLSPQVVATKLQQYGSHNNTDNIQLRISKSQTFHLILYCINRIKYTKYHIEESLPLKERHSFDCKMKGQNKRQPQFTSEKIKIMQRPEVPKSIFHQISSMSTNAAQQSKPVDYTKNKVALNQTKNLKISQRVMPSPKDSNLVSSQLDYPISVKGENDKQVPYFDEFETLLLCEEDGVSENKLTLNDSFQEFQKNDQSEKNMTIMMEMNKRKDKESKDKQMVQGMKNKIKLLIKEEKEWISANLKLKVQIKKLKSNQNINEQNQIEEMKAKIKQLKIYEKGLIKSIQETKVKSTLEILTSKTNILRDSPSKQQIINKDTILKSINGAVTNLNSSIRSNGCCDNNMPMTTGMPPQPISKRANTNISLITATNYKQSYRPYYQQIEQVQSSLMNIYSSMPSNRKCVLPNYIHPTYHQTQTQPQYHSANVSVNHMAGYGPYHQQNNMSFESVNYIGGIGQSLNSPRINNKKNTLQYFMTSTTKI